MSERQPKPVKLDGQVRGILARLAAEEIVIRETAKRGQPVDALEDAADELRSALRTFELFQRFPHAAREFFSNCMKIEREAKGDPVALSVLSAFPGAHSLAIKEKSKP